jgi:hypothetical protein
MPALIQGKRGMILVTEHLETRTHVTVEHLYSTHQPGFFANKRRKVARMPVYVN